MKKIRFFFFTGLLLSSFSASAFCQAICPIKTLKVNKAVGAIVYNDKTAKPIPNLKLELRKTNDEETLVSMATTNESGLFEFKGINKGKYILIVNFIINGISWLKYRAIVKVKKSNSSKLKPSILIRFGPDCFQTKVLTVR